MRRRHRANWIATIAEYERSDLTQERFALRHGVAVTTLRSCINKLRRERKASVSLVPVRVTPSTAPSARGRESATEIEVEVEFAAYPRSGVLAHGFARVRCRRGGGMMPQSGSRRAGGDRC